MTGTREATAEGRLGPGLQVGHDPDGPASPEQGIFGLGCHANSSKVVLIPVPFDATTSYRAGAAQGPAAILAASGQLDLYDLDTGKPWQAGICMLPPHDAIAGWNGEARRAVAEVRRTYPHSDTEALAQVNHITAQLDRWLEAEASSWLSRGHIVGTVGGDHGCIFGAIEAHLGRYPEMGILHIDAHADLRAAYEGFAGSHASIMFNVINRLPVQKLVQVGIRDFCESEFHTIRANPDRIATTFDRDLVQARHQGKPWVEVQASIINALPQEVYVSFDIDGLDPSLCPNTGTPVAGGLDFNDAMSLLVAIARSGRRLIGFDLVEVAPGPGDCEWDANVGARVLYKLCGVALSQDT